MEDLYRARQQYGAIYTTSLPNGQTIPWHPLSVGDYIKYTRDYSRGIIPSSILEDEIFRKCVVDSSVIRQMPYLNAGVVSSVVQNIWQVSGPVGVKEFNEDIEKARARLIDDGMRVIHELVQLITMAFPYKPEEIYEMDYDTFMFRLIQSEKKLLEMGMITEPLSITEPGEEEKQQPRQRPDAKKLWEEQQKITQQQKTPQPSSKQRKPSTPKGPTPSNRTKKYEVSPILEEKPTHGIDFGLEGKEAEFFGMTGHEKADAVLTRNKMIQDGQTIYADVLRELAKKKKKAP